MRIFFWLFFTVFTVFSFFAQAFEKPCGKEYSLVSFVEKGDKVLLQKRADSIVYPASLVKVMTLYLTFEAIENHKISADSVLKVSARGEEISRVNKSNTLRLKEGDKITVRDAIRGVIVKSFNEAAVTLAEGVAGDEWNFVRLMNKKAAELGMVNSSFRNSSGLHEEGQYSTAYDLARLTKAIKHDFPEYYHLFALKEFTYKGTKYETHNHVLKEYEGAEGLKTGFTNASGFNLISAATKDGNRVISVLLGCETSSRRDVFTKEILNISFAKLAKIKAEKNSEIETVKIEKLQSDQKEEFIEDEKEKICLKKADEGSKAKDKISNQIKEITQKSAGKKSNQGNKNGKKNGAKNSEEKKQKPKIIYKLSNKAS